DRHAEVHAGARHVDDLTRPGDRRGRCGYPGPTVPPPGLPVGSDEQAEGRRRAVESRTEVGPRDLRARSPVRAVETHGASELVERHAEAGRGARHRGQIAGSPDGTEGAPRGSVPDAGPRAGDRDAETVRRTGD